MEGRYEIRLVSAKKAGPYYSNPSNQICFELVDIWVGKNYLSNEADSVETFTIVYTNTIA